MLVLRFPSQTGCLGASPCPFDEDPECFHRFPVSGVFALLALVSGPAHLPDTEPYRAYAEGSDCKLADSYPFRWRHCVSPFLSPRDKAPLGWRPAAEMEVGEGTRH